ncbi:MAG TPA: carboxypeptidase regulatory-like domain-containing protein, partial [Sphingobacteriaceae bacterium]
MKILLLSAGLILLSVIHALGQLSGRLTDNNHEPVPYASVSVVSAGDSIPVAGAVSDDRGRFTISWQGTGTFRLRLSAIGFVTRYTDPFAPAGTPFVKDFGDLQLAADSRLLGEVTVRGLRPTITVKADRMVVDVEGSALASGGSALEVLEKAPGVWIDQDGNIQLNGKSGVRVMINERITYLSGKELHTLLEGMPAANVKSLEVIANPSSKYEAAGSSGILNIRLKENTAQGMNGSVYAGYQYNLANGYSAGKNVNYKKGPWNSFLNADYARRPRLREGIMTREFHSETADTRFHQLRDEDMTLKAPSFRIGTDYELGKHHSIGGEMNRNYNTTDRSFLSETLLHDRLKDRSQVIHAGNFNDASQISGAYNVHYLGQLDSSGTSLAVQLDYIKLDNKTDSRYENQYRPDQESPVLEHLRSVNPGYYDIFSAAADFKVSMRK